MVWVGLGLQLEAGALWFRAAAWKSSCCYDAQPDIGSARVVENSARQAGCELSVRTSTQGFAYPVGFCRFINTDTEPGGVNPETLGPLGFLLLMI